MKANSRNSTVESLGIFVGLAIVFAVLLAAALSVSDSFVRVVLVSVGSAILSSGLTFFLIRTFATRE
jgi:hypothetical protein